MERIVQAKIKKIVSLSLSDMKEKFGMGKQLLSEFLSYDKLNKNPKLDIQNVFFKTQIEVELNID